MAVSEDAYIRTRLESQKPKIVRSPDGLLRVPDTAPKSETVSVASPVTTPWSVVIENVQLPSSGAGSFRTTGDARTVVAATSMRANINTFIELLLNTKVLTGISVNLPAPAMAIATNRDIHGSLTRKPLTVVDLVSEAVVAREPIGRRVEDFPVHYLSRAV